MGTQRLESLIERSARPEAVRSLLEVWTADRPDDVARVKDDPHLARRLVAVVAASRDLTRIMRHDPAALDVLADLEHRAAPPSADGGTEALVAWKEREYLRIAARDLVGHDRLDATGALLAALAADVLDAACAGVGTDASGSGLAVIGMGKLGGAELNYASDIDVMFVAADGSGRDRTEHAERAARTVLEVVGRCFRVDAGLRPEGRDGPLARTVASYEAYWERWAEAWEFQALLKASPVAGDPELGERFATAAAEHLWRRPFGADELRAVRRMKQRVEEVVARNPDGGHDLKRGPGGLRDIEFSVQLLQLVHGQRDPALRVPSTLGALAELGVAGYVDGHDAEWMAHAYRFLRRIEHAVQLEDGAQTHRVPAGKAERHHLARVVGFRDTPQDPAEASFDRELAACRATVRRLHEALYFRPLLEQFAEAAPLSASATTRLEAFGFTDVDRTRQAVAELTRGLTRSSRLMQQMLPLLLDWLSISADPDVGLLGLRHLVGERTRGAQVAAAFRDSPEVARRTCLVLGSGAEVGRLLVRNADLVPALAADGPPLPDAAALHREASDAMAWRADRRTRRRGLKRFSDRGRLRLAASDLIGQIDLTQAATGLTDLAGASVDAALDELAPSVPFAVIGLGRFGGQALSYGSDLDVLFVYDGDQPSDFESATDAAGSLVRFLQGGSPAERIQTVDTSLRPEGRDGPLARSLAGFATYFDRWAQTWERQAMVLARPVAGDPEVGRRFMATIEPFVWRGVSDEERREIRRMKARVERERIPVGQDPDFHLKLGRGSLSDVEWTAQLLQLQFAVRAAGTVDAIDRLVAADHLDPSDGHALASAYRFCEQTRNRLHLVDGGGDALPAKPDRLAVLARSLDTTGPALREEYRRVTRRARRVVERVFYGRE